MDRASKNLSSLVESAVVKEMDYMLKGSHIKARSPDYQEKANKSIGGAAPGLANEAARRVTGCSGDDARGEQYLTYEQKAYLMKQKV